MNFLSHYYLDREDQRPCYIAGIALPDLVRNFNKRLRLRYQHTERDFEDEWSVQINDGVRRHLEVDDLFHGSVLFERNTEFIAQLLKKESFDAIPRHKSALAHILFEMLLDRLLIKDNPSLCKDFYAMLSSANTKSIEKYLKSLNFVNNFFDAAMFALYMKGFKKAEYLKEYIHNESLIFALNRVFAKVTGNDFSFSDRQKLNKIVIESENYLSPFYREFFNQITSEVC